MTDEFQRPPTRFEKICSVIETFLLGPVKFVRCNLVVPYQKDYPWYHQKFRRVPGIDECEQGDIICFTEANIQYKRDRMVDNEILALMRQRFEDCVMYENPDHMVRCQGVLDQYKQAEEDWFTKYGDLGGYQTVLDCYMKQKHRMIWEQRYGKVGCGMEKRMGKEEGSRGIAGEEGDGDKKKNQC